MNVNYVLSEAFQGAITPYDILSTKATVHFVIESLDAQKSEIVFEIANPEFRFSLRFENRSLILQRNESLLSLSLHPLILPNRKIRILAMWTQSALILDCGTSAEHRMRSEMATGPVAPPLELIRWARKRNLVEVSSYVDEIQFRERVYSCLNSINSKISEAAAHKSFWNFIYDGNTIVSRSPKKEVELQPLIHCLLSDQMLLSSIEVIPEHTTSAGKLDFLFVAHVKGRGLRKLCAEFKLAHSVDLEHGLIVQLPRYMKVSEAKYGAYCVLNFKGTWFDQPSKPEKANLEFYLSKIKLASEDISKDQIRCFVFHLAKPEPASKKSHGRRDSS